MSPSPTPKIVVVISRQGQGTYCEALSLVSVLIAMSSCGLEIKNRRNPYVKLLGLANLIRRKTGPSVAMMMVNDHTSETATPIFYTG